MIRDRRTRGALYPTNCALVLFYEDREGEIRCKCLRSRLHPLVSDKGDISVFSCFEVFLTNATLQMIVPHDCATFSIAQLMRLYVFSMATVLENRYSRLTIACVTSKHI